MKNTRYLGIALLVAFWSIVPTVNAKDNDYALGAAAWLEFMAVKDRQGLKWLSDEDPKAANLNFYDGSSGICLFFMNMFQITGKTKYKEYAEKTAAFLMARAILTPIGCYWPNETENTNTLTAASDESALYVGTAGIGYVFLALYHGFGNPEYQKLAAGAADWLCASAKNENGGCHWNAATDVISGASGTGLFLLYMHKATGKKEYLDCAGNAGKWLIAAAERGPDGLKWPIETGQQQFYTGFSHGTAGVGYFLAMLAEATGRKEYLEAAQAGARWLMKTAVAEHGGLKWFHHEPDGKDRFATGWCNGTAGTCRFFLELYRITKQAEYLETAQKGAAWLLATLDMKDLKGEDAGFYGLSMCCGAAGVGDFFLDMFSVTKDDAYLEYAARVGEYLACAAQPDEHGYKWTNCATPDEAGKIYYTTGYMTGAAGIGSFLLRLHAYSRNAEDQFVPFADKPRIAATPGIKPKRSRPRATQFQP